MDRRRSVMDRRGTMKDPTRLARTSLLVFTFCLAYGQNLEKPRSFDVASVKPHTNSGGAPGGKGSGDLGAAAEARIPLPPPQGGLRFTPGRVVSAPAGVTARKIILEAYHLTQYQLFGGPGWLGSDRFDLEAKAEAANENQLRQMLQTLLAE